MSYSFQVRASTRNGACIAVREKLDEVVRVQKCHQVDVMQAVQVAETFIMLLPDDDTKDVCVTMNGYVSGIWEGDELRKLIGCSVSVSAGYVDRQP